MVQTNSVQTLILEAVNAAITQDLEAALRAETKVRTLTQEQNSILRLLSAKVATTMALEDSDGGAEIGNLIADYLDSITVQDN